MNAMKMCHDTITRAEHCRHGTELSSRPRRGPFLRLTSLIAGLALLGVLLPAASAQSLTALRSLTRATDGGAPNGSLILANDGMLYGTAITGGANGAGTIYRLAADGTGFTVLRDLISADGTAPAAGLVQGRDGKLYGTATAGGSAGGGTVFRLNLDGTGFTVLRSFTSATDGAAPNAIVEGIDGRLYGTTINGGTSSSGTIYRINADGTGFTVLRHFVAATDGKNPQCALVQCTDARFYGTTSSGGTNNFGTIFGISPDGGSFTVLRQLDTADGTAPYGRLVQAANGRLYGTTIAGGANALGTIFRVNLDGLAFSVVRDLVAADGTLAYAGLTSGTDGALYGVTSGGGSNGAGTTFRLTLADGGYSVLRHLVAATDGSASYARLTLGSDGRFYGTASLGGATGDGTLFVFSPPPIVNSALTGTGTVGQSFSYTITGTSTPTAFAATGLPTGLTVNTATGIISGAPTQAGSFAVIIAASNSGGSSGAGLALTIAKGTATVSLSNLSQTADGTAKLVAATTVPAGLTVTTTYNGSATLPTTAGSYAVVSTISDNNYQGTTSGTLVIGSAVAPAISAQTASPTAIAGTNVSLSVTATGTATLTYQWQRKAAGASAFTDLTEGSSFTGVASATLVVVSPTILQSGDQFRVVVTNAGGSTTGNAITLTVIPSNRLRNFSIRANVGTGLPLIVGFVTNGGPRQLLLRAIGPGLTPYVSAGTTLAADPTLALYNGPTIAAANDNWGGTATLSSAFSSVGAFSLTNTSLDSALLANVNGAYTAQMSTTITGLGLVEAYDTGTDTAIRVVNFSALYQVGNANATLIAGFAVAGTGTKTLLIRGIGPGLRPYGVNDNIADPKIDVYDGGNVRLTGNDDWAANLAATFVSAGAFPLTTGSKDSALVITVQPGNYSVQLTSADGSAGRGLIEIYELQQ